MVETPKTSEVPIPRLWFPIRRAPNRIIAEMWHELFEAEGIPCHILPEDPELVMAVGVPYKVCIPLGREHIIEEILRKL